MIVVEHLTKRYGERLAVNDVGFTVAKGEIVGFLGPNGAGKSTTMRMLTGFLSPTAGAVSIGGVNMAEDPLAAKQQLGYLPETPPLYPEMTVADYLNFVGRLKGLTPAERKVRLSYVLERCFLGDRAKQLIGTLSKGYKQRVGIAQALIHNPPALILDEPTSGLDPAQIIQIRDLIQDLAADHTVILSTHILPEVQSTCSRVLIIAGGQLVAEGTPESLDARLRGGSRVSALVRAEGEAARAAVASIAGVRQVEISSRPHEPGLTLVEADVSPEHDVREAIARTVAAQGWGLLELKSVSLSLEEIFLKLTTQEQGAPQETATNV